MKKEFKITKQERNEMITEIADQTFSKLSCRMDGVGMYQELMQALKQAYKLGKTKRKELKEQRVIQLLPMNIQESVINNH